jgi:hypothetical protein
LAPACRLAGAGLHVALVVRFLRDRYRLGRDRRWTIAAVAAGLHVGDDSVRRGLIAAERAGLLAVDRKPGRKILAADVTILAPPETGADRRPLRGPIPWRWLHPALRLPTPALRAAMACWLTAGWGRSAEFELALSGWALLGLSRQAAGRGLDQLRRAGLVGVHARPGNSPIVTIRDTPGAVPGERGDVAAGEGLAAGIPPVG